MALKLTALKTLKITKQKKCKYDLKIFKLKKNDLYIFLKRPKNIFWYEKSKKKKIKILLRI